MKPLSVTGKEGSGVPSTRTVRGLINDNPEVEAGSQHQRGLLLAIAIEFTFSYLDAVECVNIDAVPQFPAEAVRRIEASQ